MWNKIKTANATKSVLRSMFSYVQAKPNPSKRFVYLRSKARNVISKNPVYKQTNIDCRYQLLTHTPPHWIQLSSQLTHAQQNMGKLILWIVSFSFPEKYHTTVLLCYAYILTFWYTTLWAFHAKLYSNTVIRYCYSANGAIF